MIKFANYFQISSIVSSATWLQIKYLTASSKLLHLILHLKQNRVRRHVSACLAGCFLAVKKWKNLQLNSIQPWWIFHFEDDSPLKHCVHISLSIGALRYFQPDLQLLGEWNAVLGSVVQQRWAATFNVLMPRKSGTLCQRSLGRSRYADVLPSVKNQRQLWSKHLLCYFTSRCRSPYGTCASCQSQPPRRGIMHFPGLKRQPSAGRTRPFPQFNFT